MEIRHEHGHLPVCVRPPHADVVDPAFVAQRHGTSSVDPVTAYPCPFRHVELRADRIRLVPCFECSRGSRP